MNKRERETDRESLGRALAGGKGGDNLSQHRFQRRRGYSDLHLARLESRCISKLETAVMKAAKRFSKVSSGPGQFAVTFIKCI